MMQSVQVIIERLKSHPEDFFGGFEGRGLGQSRPKFNDVREKLDDLLIEKPDVGHTHRLWYLEPEEKEALLAAYKEARRARFEAKVFHTLLTKQEEPVNTVTMNTLTRYTGTGAANAVPHTLGWEPESVWVKAQVKAEGANIVDRINQEFEKEYAKNRNP